MVLAGLRVADGGCTPNTRAVDGCSGGRAPADSLRGIMTGDEPMERSHWSHPEELGAQPGRTAAILSLVWSARVPRDETDLNFLDVTLFWTSS